MSRTRRTTRLTVGIAALSLAMAMSLTVAAGHQFTDVPDSNIFHDDITWLADNDITRGCNPPTNTRFCPGDNVTREQMAAFMHRFAGTSGAVGDFTDSSTLIAVPASGARAEVLSVTVTPESEAVVVLSTNVSFTKSGVGTGTYQVLVMRDSCTELQQRLNDGAVWTSAGTDLERMTLPVNAIDTVSGPTTYKVCISGSNTNANVSRSAVTAHWMPAG